MRVLTAVLLALLATAAAAQQRPVFDPDDFVDPRLHPGSVFIPRLLIGAGHNLIDDYRPLHDDGVFVFLANSFYWSRFQVDYKHSETWTQNDPPRVVACGCSQDIFFPTPRLPNETPDPPHGGARDMLQFGFYYARQRPEQRPLMQRLRLTLSEHRVLTEVHSPVTGEITARFKGNERSVGLEGDTYLPIRGHEFFGTVAWAYLTEHGMRGNRRQQELTYTSRIPAVSVRSDLLLRSMLTVGSITGRGGTAINLVNPYFEAIWHDVRTEASVHLVWSPQITNDGAHGWQITQQIVLFADRHLFVHLFGRNL